MKSIRWALLLLTISVMTLSTACGGAEVETESPEPAEGVEETTGDDAEEFEEEPEELEEDPEETEDE
ncbi:MAG: hypothetical protein AAF609_13410 [Cyanobacteria bacterium P01_C01_bin.120]